MLGVSKLLSFAIPIFVLAMDSIAISLVATSWLAYEKAAAIATSCLMCALIIVSSIVFSPAIVMAWYTLLGGNLTVERDVECKRSKFLKEHNEARSTDSEKERKKEHDFANDVRGASAIHFAVAVKVSQRYHSLLLQILLAGGEEPDRQVPNGTTPLMLAAFVGNNSAVELLLEAGADPNLTATTPTATPPLTHNTTSTQNTIISRSNSTIDTTAKTCWTAMLLTSDMDIFRQLRDAGGKTDPFELKGPEVLYLAAENNDIPLLKEVLKCGVGINSRSMWNETVLHVAACKGHTAMVEALLKVDGLDVNAVDGRGDTAFHYAAYYGHVEIAKLLLTVPGVDLTIIDVFGRTAVQAAEARGHNRIAAMIANGFFFAARENNLALVMELLDKGVGIDLRSVEGDTILHVAVNEGHTGMVEALLKVPGLDVNGVDEDGNTALHLAAKWGANQKVVEILLDAPSIAVNATNKDCDTALHCATMYGHVNIAEMLLKVDGLDVNAVDAKGRTALHWATLYGHVNIAEMLLKAHGVEVNAVDADGGTALHGAALKGNVEIVKRLLTVPGLYVNATNEDGDTALHLATLYGHVNIAEMLLKVDGVEVNAVSKFGGDTALHCAVSSGHDEIVELLLKVPGFDVNGVDEVGRTALHLAAYLGRVEIAKLLLTVPRVDLTITDDKGRTAAQLAEMWGYTRIVAMIAKYEPVPVCDAV